MARQVKRYIMRGLGRSVKVLSVGASIPEEDIAFPTWRLSAHPTVESLMEASSQRNHSHSCHTRVRHILHGVF